jgi:excisionase family DNA binding protein
VNRDPTDLVIALAVISGKWKVRIVYLLMDGTKRFGELRRLLPGVHRGTLSFELRRLEADGVVRRRQYPTMPPDGRIQSAIWRPIRNRIELQTLAVENSPLMTPDEVAILLRVHRSWVYAHQQELPGFVRLGRYVRFRRIAIEEFLRQKFPCQ